MIFSGKRQWECCLCMDGKNISLYAFSMVLFFCQIVEAQSILRSGMPNDFQAEAEIKLADFFELESKFPEKFAAYTTFKVTSFTEGGIHEKSGFQVYAADSRKNVWRSILVVKSGDTNDFVYEGFYNGNKLLEKVADVLLNNAKNPPKWSLVGTPQGSESKEVGYFNPRHVWLCPPDYIECVEDTSISVLNGTCFASKSNKQSLLGLFAKEKCVGLNRVTELSFAENGLPASAILLPSLNGDFSKEEALGLVKKYGYHCLVIPVWAETEGGFFELAKIVMESDFPVDHDHAVFKNRWLYDEKVIDSVLADPRLETTPSLRELNFQAKKK